MKPRNSPTTLLGAALLLGASALCGCGRKGDPVAPLSSPAVNIRDLQVRLECQSSTLSFSVPQTRTDGTVLERPVKVELYRRRYLQPTPMPSPTPGTTPTPGPGTPVAGATPAPPQKPPAVPVGPFAKIGELLVASDGRTPAPPAARKRSPTPAAPTPVPERLSWVDKGETEPFEPGYLYLYQVVVVDEDGEVSAPSNTVQMEYAIVPGAPLGLVGRAGRTGVELAWKAPTKDCAGQAGAAVESYNVYRRAAEPGFSNVPINSAPVIEPRYVDAGAELDRNYSYVVRAAASGPRREGASSAEVAVKTEDVYPPDPPSGLVVTRTRDGVSLLWNPSPSKDVAGYHVERAAGGVWKRLTAEPTAKTSFLDKDTEARKKYRYRVVAIDRAVRSNPSVPSEEVPIDEP